MILSFGHNPDLELLERAKAALSEAALDFQVVVCARSTLIIVTSDSDHFSGHKFSTLPGVVKVVRLGSRTPLALEGGRSRIEVSGNGGKFLIGGEREPVVLAGPCAVESFEQISAVASAARVAGAQGLRGGAYKPRSSPYDFQGLGIEGLKLMQQAGQANQMPVISEVMSPEQIAPASPYIDVFQVGARNMYNYELLKELGRQRKPVVLKRGISATVDELLQAAEYILLGGNLQVILCERGIRTFETSTRNTLDLSAVAVLKNLSNLPVIVDPSHAAGKRDLIRPLSRAAIACGADGLIIETHTDPDKSYSDAGQAITPSTLAQIVQDVRVIYGALKTHDEKSQTSEPVVASVPGSVMSEREQIFSGYRQS
ncbi:MAG: 3-deoxy-7-phosphoheptulonate synthase [Cyanobacteria bacterium SZAS LIN-2]|nr:3-deoxy-7-phosphoheptulonate synthase [Cyanobacteria bacterium SZAS LIN-2]